jgi:antitoxin (DNA-binding transcriptional repressor) of toxin-antitoxin stability system
LNIVSVLSTVPDVETIAISKFKAACLAELERVRATGEPLLVTNGGVPVAQIVPPPDSEGASMRTVDLDWEDLEAANWSWTPRVVGEPESAVPERAAERR